MMSQPQTEKQKTSDGKEPITFTVRNAKPDIRMYVFDTEYHVHSDTLKVSSGFFATYLDPSGGVSPSSTSPHFHSDWFTAIDEDGTWHLSSDHKHRNPDFGKLTKGQLLESIVFHSFLCALFNRDYRMVNIKELSILVGMADYYRALPMVSSSITSSMLNKTSLISDDPCTSLELACKLRNKALFKDSLIFSLGPWSKPQYKKLETSMPDLYKIADEVHTRLSKQISDFWIFLVQLAADRIPLYDDGYEIDSNLDGMGAVNSFFQCASTREGSNVVLPTVFHKAYHSSMKVHSLAGDDGWSGINWLADRLRPFVQNNLVLGKISLDEEEFEDHFFCFEIDDKDLPWDVEQHDW